MAARNERKQALQRRAARFEQRRQRLRRLSARYSRLRLITFLAGAGLSGLAWQAYGLWPAVIGLALSAGLWGVLVYFHTQVDQAALRYQTWLDIKQTQMARMDLDWEHIPLLSRHHPRAEHPFEFDLDLVGKRSLHHLLDTTVSHEGSRRLRAWLTAPQPELEPTLARQQRVRELVGLGLFRDKFAIHARVASDGKKTWDARPVLSWLEDRLPASVRRLWLPWLSGLAGLNAALFVLNRLGWLPPVWIGTFMLYLALVLFSSRLSQAAFEQTMATQDSLRQFKAVWGQLERFGYPNTPHLNALCAPFHTTAGCPSTYWPRVTRALGALSLRGNGLAWLMLNALLPWDMIVIDQLDRCKQALAQRLPAWLDVWYELDALMALANFADLNPDLTFPEMGVDESAPGQAGRSFSAFRAEGMGHPLIPAAERVCNDFTIASLGDMAIITGANMAGKSAFLKTLGVNLALAYAGGPVCARFFQTGLFRLFTCMRINDSINDGISYFYAEVKRLRALLSELEREPALSLFFCVDELFRGTNNRERLIGSCAFVSNLAGRNGVGLGR